MTEPQNLKTTRMLTAALTILAVIVFGATNAQSQPDKKDKALKFISQIQSGEPEKVKTENGYKLVYKNDKGETFKEEKFSDLDVKLEMKKVVYEHPNGKAAAVDIETFGEKDGKLGVHLTSEYTNYDSKGKITGSVVNADFDENGKPTKQTVTKDGKTIEYERDFSVIGGWREIIQDTKVEQPKLQEKEVFKEEPPAPKLEPAGTKAPLDPCVVGKWQSETIDSLDGVPFARGISMSIARDGLVSINYNAMEPKRHIDPTGSATSVQAWRGTATGRISAKSHVVTVKSVESSALTFEITAYGRTTKNALSGLGIVFLPSPCALVYKCTPGEFTIQATGTGMSQERYIFRRLEL